MASSPPWGMAIHLIPLMASAIQVSNQFNHQFRGSISIALVSFPVLSSSERCNAVSSITYLSPMTCDT